MSDIKEQAFNNLIMSGMPEDQARDIAEVYMWATDGDFHKMIALIELLVRPGRPHYAKRVADQIREAQSDE